MALLTDAQKSALFGRLLGVNDERTLAATVPERIPPTGTVVGTEPGALAAITQNRTMLLVGGVLLVVAVLYLAKKI